MVNAADILNARILVVDDQKTNIMLLERLLLAVSQPYRIAEQEVSMTTSIGVGLYPAHGMDNETLMKHADLAMYAAKHVGKNNYRIATVSELPATASPI
jgi:two-component system cell cycle response regulator